MNPTSHRRIAAHSVMDRLEARRIATILGLATMGIVILLRVWKISLVVLRIIGLQFHQILKTHRAPISILPSSVIMREIINFRLIPPRLPIKPPTNSSRKTSPKAPLAPGSTHMNIPRLIIRAGTIIL